MHPLAKEVIERLISEEWVVPPGFQRIINSTITKTCKRQAEWLYIQGFNSGVDAILIAKKDIIKAFGLNDDRITRMEELRNQIKILVDEMERLITDIDGEPK